MLGVMDPIHRAWVVQWEHCGEGSNRFPADKLLKATRKRTSSRVLTPPGRYPSPVQRNHPDKVAGYTFVGSNPTLPTARRSFRETQHPYGRNHGQILR